MSEPFSILILASWYPSSVWPSLGSFVKEQARALVRSGFKVNVIYPNLYSPKRILEYKKIKWGFHYENSEGVGEYQYYSLKCHIPFIDCLRLSSMGKKLFSKYLIHNPVPDIIHLHTFLSGKIVLSIHKKYNIPYVVTEHFSGFMRGLITKQQKKLACQVYNHSRLNIAVSEPFKMILEDLTKAAFTVIPNMVDTNYFRPSPDKFVEYTFLSVGNLEINKNQIALIEAFSKLYKNDAKIKLFIAGNGSQRDILEKKVRELNLFSSVIFMGHLSRNEVRNVMQKSHCLVLPSTYETFGIVLIEALSCGIPVVSTCHGGPESFIKDPSLGILTEVDADSLLSAMKLIRDRTYSSNLLHNWVVKRYSKEVIIEKLRKEYHKVLTP